PRRTPMDPDETTQDPDVVSEVAAQEADRAWALDHLASQGAGRTAAPARPTATLERPQEPAPDPLRAELDQLHGDIREYRGLPRTVAEEESQRSQAQAEISGADQALERQLSEIRSRIEVEHFDPISVMQTAMELVQSGKVPDDFAALEEAWRVWNERTFDRDAIKADLGIRGEAETPKQVAAIIAEYNRRHALYAVRREEGATSRAGALAIARAHLKRSAR
ncbi:MAG: hypothetical protein ACREJS_15310, partial [Candidatus Rokuibacteriota bacterium]